LVEKKIPKNSTLENIGEELYPGIDGPGAVSQASFRDDFNFCYTTSNFI
jgi:hypothetical protein